MKGLKMMNKIQKMMSVLSCALGFSKATTNPEDIKYVTVKDQHSVKPQVLKTKTQRLTFPLSNEDWEDIKALESKYDNEKNCAGLAAPQIGIGKAITVFALPLTEEIKKRRPDCVQGMEKQIWVNPIYIPIEEAGKKEDYEGCFSVTDVAGPVSRWNKIRYEAYKPTGEKLEGIAEGFLARIMQHEIDHLNGILCIDLVPEGKTLPLEELKKRFSERAKQAEAQEKEK